jgi:hypothetical protein
MRSKRCVLFAVYSSPKYGKHNICKLDGTNSLDIHKSSRVYRDAIAVVKGINMR